MDLINREAWLTKAIEKLRILFEQKAYSLPTNIKVSCGWPGASNLSKTIGQCWDFEASKKKDFEIFISPILDDPVGSTGILSTLVHELIHTLVGIDKKHGPEFKEVAIKMGLAGKMRATFANEELQSQLKSFVEELGEYPHGSLNPKTKIKKERTKNFVVATCDTCSYTIRIMKKFIDEGIPKCPVCDIEFSLENSDENEE